MTIASVPSEKQDIFSIDFLDQLLELPQLDDVQMVAAIK